MERRRLRFICGIRLPLSPPLLNKCDYLVSSVFPLRFRGGFFLLFRSLGGFFEYCAVFGKIFFAERKLMVAFFLFLMYYLLSLRLLSRFAFFWDLRRILVLLFRKYLAIILPRERMTFANAKITEITSKRRDTNWKIKIKLRRSRITRS